MIDIDIIISHRWQRSVASTQSRCVYDSEPLTTRNKCQKVCRRQFIESRGQEPVCIATACDDAQ